MKRFLLYVSSVVLVTVGVFIGSTLIGSNAVAQKLAAIAGVGTQDHLAKWINGTGTLGNSAIIEDKSGNLTLAGSLRFPDGSIQSSALASNSDALASHHQELTIIAAPDESPTFPLPRKDAPVRIDVSTSVIVEQFVCNGQLGELTTGGPFATGGVIAVDSATGHSTGSGGGFTVDFWQAHIAFDPSIQRLRIFVTPACTVPPQNGCFCTNPGACCNFTPQFVISGPITYHVSMWY